MISVIMGLYNCEFTLDKAIESIIHQTYSKWELIMCDDGSSDNTYMIASMYKEMFPDKIILLRNNENKGLNYTLNKCLKFAQGKYIARMDGDDICSPERFEEEIAVLENEQNIAIVSTAMEYFDESGVWGVIKNKEYPDKMEFLKGTPFCHAPCMVRKEAIEKVNGYTVGEKFLRVEDYHLWIKMYKAGYKGKNIDKVLYSMRDDRNAYRRRKFKYRLNEAYVRYLAIKELRLPVWGYVCVLRPVIVGIIPEVLYEKLHKRRLLKGKK